MRDIFAAYRSRPWQLLILDLVILLLLVGLLWTSAGKPHPLAPPAAHEESV